MNIYSFKELKKLSRQLCGSCDIRVALIGDSATQLLATALKGMGRTLDYTIELFEADYNQAEMQFMDPSSELHQFEAEYIILFQSTHKLGEKHSRLPFCQQETLAKERLDFIENICTDPYFSTKKLICLNYPEIDDTVFGSYANTMTSSFIYQVRKLNYELMKMSQTHPNLYVCDIAALQSKIGRDQMFSPNIYTSTEMLLSVDALPFVAGRVMDIVSACKGQFKKCLILDLDNTLWGGVIGDDGVEGIQLGHGLGIGKAFTEFQLWLKKLRQRGIILCIASKNNEATAKEPFIHHPEMVLHLDDIAVFMANWETKVDNIRTIQSILNIGFDSMVFLDDNPFERHMVREHIPSITVPELPEDPALYLEYLYSLNLFETANFSIADKDRTQQYQVEAKRTTLKRTFDNEADFLKSLNMLAEVSGFNAFNTPRIAQLSHRSNQFNLRTIRYTEADIQRFSTDSTVIDLSFTLRDKFGDNGLIAVVIMKEVDNETLFIDTWFMSCRVLKRGMENFTLNTLVEEAIRRGYKRLTAEYVPTPKNSMVADHYDRLGFNLQNQVEVKTYELILEHYKFRPCYIEKVQ